MPRIATLTTILAIAVAPAALARPADYRSADPHTADRAALTQLNRHQDHRRLPSSHANLPSVAVIDRTAPAASRQPAASDGSDITVWAALGLIAGGLAVFAGLAFVVRRHYQLGPPAKA